tara:strand:+ start:10846 stop:11628 length:783 start_codon:yes stop_codon:yes gene_type:complete
MIKFFRKIRQSLLSENKFSKYFLYAIGEIVLVVIGILIALQINNWNENKKASNSEKAILIGLKSEFQNNLVTIDSTIQANKNVSQACALLTEIIRSNNLEEKTKKVDSLILRMLLISSFDANTGVTEEILNSGKLELIKSNRIRERIAGWTSKLNDIEEDVEFRFVNYNQSLIPFLTEYFPLANGDVYKKNINGLNKEYITNYKDHSNFKPIYKDLNLMKMENVIWHHKHNNDYVISQDYSVRKEILEIIDIVNKELEKK